MFSHNKSDYCLLCFQINDYCVFRSLSHNISVCYQFFIIFFFVIYDLVTFYGLHAQRHRFREIIHVFFWCLQVTLIRNW